MFIEAYKSTDTGTEGVYLAFIKSMNVQAYPCGRRRSTQISSGETAYSIPFDPEARLNTEANNRKHTSINGYTQTFLNNWATDTEDKLSVVLAGYLFNITRDKTIETNGTTTLIDYTEPEVFAKNIINTLATAATGDTTAYQNSIKNAERIYVNVIVDEQLLFESEDLPDYRTGVLCNQSRSDTSTFLDLPATGKDLAAPDSYYFSGLSFSIQPLTNKADTRSSTLLTDAGTVTKRIESLCLLEKVNGAWQVHHPAKLPDIKHGDTPNSVEIDDINAKQISQNSKSVPSLQLKNLGGTYQLQFYNVDKLDKLN